MPPPDPTAVFSIVKDIKEGMGEVRTDVKELRKEFHELALKVAALGDTDSKVDALEDRVSRIDERIDKVDERANAFEKTLAVASNEAGKVQELQRTTWQLVGRVAGVAAALASAGAFGALISKLTGS